MSIRISELIVQPTTNLITDWVNMALKNKSCLWRYNRYSQFWPVNLRIRKVRVSDKSEWQWSMYSHFRGRWVTVMVVVMLHKEHYLKGSASVPVPTHSIEFQLADWPPCLPAPTHFSLYIFINVINCFLVLTLESFWTCLDWNGSRETTNSLINQPIKTFRSHCRTRR